ncbi:MAG: MogA/MoaB family molybdenum cofactor biosynthesis protein [Desulfobacterales bacterium]|nr:MogA/MoaB family molybdenum cofactor biosynthesis protein [Desulfobacterales bacterium]
MSSQKHKDMASKMFKVGILTVSSSRSLTDDISGRWISKRAEKEGHEVVIHKVIPDDIAIIRNTVLDVIHDLNPHVVLLTGGTGITSQDVTIEALRPLFEKELTAFGPLFAQLSYEEIDSAAILSRATAGIIEKTILFCMPGSLKACKLALKALIFPELGHLVKHVYE